MDRGRRVQGSLLGGTVDGRSLPEQSRGACKSEFGMIADQERPVVSPGRRELSRDHRAGSRLQSRSQMLCIVDEDKIVR